MHQNVVPFRMSWSSWVLGAAAASTCGVPAFAQSIAGFGVHPTSGQPVRPSAVSDDGAVASGWVHDGVDLHAIRWTSAGGMQDLGVAPGSVHSYGNGVSGDGSVVVGDEHGGPNGGGAFLWTGVGGVQPLGPALGWVTSYLTGVSGDGATVIGLGQALNGYFYGFRWSSAGGMQLLDPLDQFGDESPANVSRDGSAVVGSHYFGRAFRWTSAGGMQDLGSFPGQVHAQAADVSDDGAVVVGSSGTWTTSTGWAYLHAFRWTTGGGMQDLGTLPGDVRSEAVGVSGDGSIVVGMGLDATLSISRAFAWTQASGMVELGAYVAALGVNLTGWNLGEVRGISADGSAIFGHGLFNGGSASWIVTGLGRTGTAFCFGDGSGTICPCGNSGTVGNGCASSLNASGANLSGSGVASIANDTFVLSGTGMPNSSALYFQGTGRVNAGAGSVFGDGLRCAGGSVTRLGTQVNAGGGSQYPTGGDLAVSVKGSNVAGGVRTYQVWYRNAAAFCTADTFNVTNGYEVTWLP